MESCGILSATLNPLQKMLMVFSSQHTLPRALPRYLPRCFMSQLRTKDRGFRENVIFRPFSLYWCGAVTLVD